MSCTPKCSKTASLAGPGGPRIMISEPGNLKYPMPHTPHPQCKECQEEEAKAINEEIKICELFNWDQDLIARYKKVMSWNKGGK